MRIQTQTPVFRANANNQPPQKPEKPEGGNFFTNYADNVEINFKDRGVGGTLLHAGGQAFVGGIGGYVGGALAGVFIGGHLAHTFGAIGALGGIAYGLQDHK